MAQLELIDIVKRFGSGRSAVTALDGVTLRAAPGEFVVLIGPSGCGKTTLLEIAAGLQIPDAGAVRLDGASIAGRTGLIGYMPQRDLLLPWRTLLQNAVLGADARGEPRAAALARARSLLPVFGLTGFENAYPSALSGGMRQRTAFLRTVLLDSPVLALDEPFGALDALTRREMQAWLAEIWSDLRTTIFLVTHDVSEALFLADRIVVLSPRPGRVCDEWTIDLPRPRRATDPRLRELEDALLCSLGLAPAGGERARLHRS